MATASKKEEKKDETPKSFFSALIAKAAAKKGTSISLPADKLSELAKSLQFGPNLSEEDKQALIAGGEGAVAVMFKMQQSVAEQSFQKALAASAKITEDALANQMAQVEAMLPDLVRTAQTKDSMRKALPGLAKDSDLSPIVELIQAGIQANNPDATAEELTAATQEQLSKFASSISPSQELSENNKTENFDFAAYLGIPKESFEKPVVPPLEAS